MIGYYSCYACQDSWCRDLIDQEVEAYIEENPELAEQIISGEITDVDLGEVLCDGCEDFFQDEADLAGLDEQGDDLEDEIDRMADLIAHGRI